MQYWGAKGHGKGRRAEGSDAAAAQARRCAAGGSRGHDRPAGQRLLKRQTRPYKQRVGSRRSPAAAQRPRTHLRKFRTFLGQKFT